MSLIELQKVEELHNIPFCWNHFESLPSLKLDLSKGREHIPFFFHFDPYISGISNLMHLNLFMKAGNISDEQIFYIVDIRE